PGNQAHVTGSSSGPDQGPGTIQKSRRVEDQVRVRGARVGSAPLSHALDDEGSTGTHTVPSSHDTGDLGVVFSDRSPHELAPSPNPTPGLLLGSAVEVVDVVDIGVEEVEVIGGILGVAVCLRNSDVLSGRTYSRGVERVNYGRRIPVVTVDRIR